MRRQAATRTAVTLAGAAAAAGVVWAVVAVPPLVVPPLPAAEIGAVQNPQDRIKLRDDHTKLQNDLRTAMLQTIAGLAVAGGLVLNYRSWRLNRDGQLTEQFSTAAGQLGTKDSSDEMALRAIYALARIARESPADRDTVALILAEHVRRRAPWEPLLGGLAATTPEDRIPPMRDRLPTVQAALTALGALPRARRSGPVLPLARTDLRGADLTGADLRGADLRGAHLERAILHGADLTGALR